MEIKQRGNALGYKLVLFLYRLFGYDFAVFILNFIAFYYLLFTPSVKRQMQRYYKLVDLPSNSKIYFLHIKQFAISIFDRFISRIAPKDLEFAIHNLDIVHRANEGGVVLLAHIGSWSTAAHCLEDGVMPMSIVMRENTQESIYKVEQSNKRYNEKSVKIIDLSLGSIATNIQIANALSNKEFVAMMADRVINPQHKIAVTILNQSVYINKTPFEIAKRLDKPLIALFVLQKGYRKYDLLFEKVEGRSVKETAQQYSDLLSRIIKNYPLQWYNFYDFFKKG